MGSHLRCVELWQIDADRLLRGTCDHDHCRLTCARIFFPMRQIRRYEDVVAGTGRDADFVLAVVENEVGMAAAHKYCRSDSPW